MRWLDGITDSMHVSLSELRVEWVAVSFSRESSRPIDRTQVSRIVDRRFYYRLSLQGSPFIREGQNL